MYDVFQKMLNINVYYSYKQLDSCIPAKVHNKVNVEGRLIRQAINCVAEFNHLFLLAKIFFLY